MVTDSFVSMRGATFQTLLSLLQDDAQAKWQWRSACKPDANSMFNLERRRVTRVLSQSLDSSDSQGKGVGVRQPRMLHFTGHSIGIEPQQNRRRRFGSKRRPAHPTSTGWLKQIASERLGKDLAPKANIAASVTAPTRPQTNMHRRIRLRLRRERMSGGSQNSFLVGGKAAS